jgi:hypothetical protein
MFSSIQKLCLKKLSKKIFDQHCGMLEKPKTHKRKYLPTGIKKYQLQFSVFLVCPKSYVVMQVPRTNFKKKFVRP